MHLFAMDKCNKMHLSSKVFNLKLECSTAIGICPSLPDETSTLCNFKPAVLSKLTCYSKVFVFSPITKIFIKCSSQCGWLVDQMYKHLKACTSWMCYHHRQSHVLSIKKLVQKCLWVMFNLTTNYLGTTPCKTKQVLAFLLILWEFKNILSGIVLGDSLRLRISR